MRVWKNTITKLQKLQWASYLNNSKVQLAVTMEILSEVINLWLLFSYANLFDDCLLQD